MKFPVWKTLAVVADYGWQERAVFFRCAAIPLIVSIVSNELIFRFVLIDAADRRTKILVGLAGVLLQTIAYLPMTVTWYRMLVFGEAEAERRPFFTLGRLEGRLILWQIAIPLIAVAVALVCAAVIAGLYFAIRGAGGPGLAGMVAALLGIATFIGLMVTVMRLNFVLVAAAAGEPASLKGAWRMSTGMGGRLALALLVIVLASMLCEGIWKLCALLFGMIIAMAAGTTMDAVTPYLTIAGHSVTGLLTFLAIATLFGMLYRTVRELHPDATTPPAEIPPAAPVAETL